MRLGFESLVNDIELASQANTKRSRTELAIEKAARKDLELEELRKENEILKTRYMSLLYQNYELSNVIQKSGIKVPKFGTATSISIFEENTS